ncbi:MAG: hypothetical protein ACREMB_00630 [Candidatus Rokuibacteriota bacterium]
MAENASIGGAAPDLEYPTAAGETRRLRDLWAAGPALVLWLRHFG